jgi:tetratricopeptide (TPR) repeat protein/transcriptional regulator with XRE-family HTH domain
VGVGEPPVTFGAFLRELRVTAGLTQEELAAAAGLSARSVSDLERGVALTARKDTARLLADGLGLEGVARTEFEAAARGRSPAMKSSAPRTGGVAAATRTLPRDIASFTGREAELRQLIEPVLEAGSSGGVVSIHAIGGMAGVGKTALAVHAAHQLASRFPDGQVFLQLHGHTPGQQPVSPQDALASLLLIAGVPVGQIPPGLEARMALWRDHLAGKQLLLVLDDAAGNEQVAPLLPGTGGSLVLVTSRRHLTALEDAQSISLDTLPADQATELLVRLAARPGLHPADPAVGEVTRSCGYLPLAVGMLARRLHHHPTWTIDELAADLAAATTRLELMHAENLSVAAAFDLSYAELPSGQQRLFRQLGLHPGTEIDAYAAAALNGTNLSTARRYLDDLYERYLITEPARGRYRLHDLIREHARSLAASDPPDECHAALDRLLDYYTHTAAASDRLLAFQPGTRPDPVDVSSLPAAIPALDDQVKALAWARGERANLLACLDHASRTGDQARVVVFTAGLSALLRIDGPWTDAITRHATAVKAARKLGDQLGQANALKDLGSMRQFACDYRGAARALREAFDIYQDLGDQLGQADVLSSLGLVRWLACDYPGAARALEQALSICRDLGDLQGQANALLDLGATRIVTGDTAGAIQAIEQALNLSRDLGDREYEAQALLDLGNARLETGDYPGAARVVEEALDISLNLGDRRGEAWALIYLGRLRRLTGKYAGGTQALDKALGIFQDLGDPRGCGNALLCLGTIQRLTGDFEGATKSVGSAMDTFLDLGEPRGRAKALCELAVVRRLTTDYSDAAEALAEALSIYRDIGDRNGQTETLNETATLHRVRGDLAQATACHREALVLAREIGSSWHEAHALAGLARADLAADRATHAEVGLRQAQEIFQRIGATEAASVTAELQELNSKFIAKSMWPTTGTERANGKEELRPGSGDRDPGPLSRGPVEARDRQEPGAAAEHGE